MELCNIPNDFDGQTYLALYPDLRAAGVNPVSHYLEYGRSEGRNYLWNHTPRFRHELLAKIWLYDSVLEIGPFDRPASPNYMNALAKVEYADWMGTDDLMARAATLPDRNPTGVPHISYVVTDSLSASIQRKYACVISSHMIEHVPDLVTHLQDIQSLLEPGGAYLFIAPDKRDCFDHCLPESALPEVITAYLEKRTRPSLRSVIEHRAFTVPKYKLGADPVRHPSRDLWPIIRSAQREFQESTYVDVHCWYFTPESLSQIVNALIELGLISHHWRIQTFQLGGEIGGFFKLICDQ